MALPLDSLQKCIGTHTFCGYPISPLPDRSGAPDWAVSVCVVDILDIQSFRFILAPDLRSISWIDLVIDQLATRPIYYLLLTSYSNFLPGFLDHTVYYLSNSIESLNIYGHLFCELVLSSVFFIQAMIFLIFGSINLYAF